MSGTEINIYAKDRECAIEEVRIRYKPKERRFITLKYSDDSNCKAQLRLPDNDYFSGQEITLGKRPVKVEIKTKASTTGEMDMEVRCKCGDGSWPDEWQLVKGPIIIDEVVPAMTSFDSLLTFRFEDEVPVVPVRWFINSISFDAEILDEGRADAEEFWALVLPGEYEVGYRDARFAIEAASAGAEPPPASRKYRVAVSKTDVPLDGVDTAE